MAISIFELFSVGIGPSSSHTVGPMRAARQFLVTAKESGVFENIERVKVELIGSLALTGIGHSSDKAVILGLLGETPEEVPVLRIPDLLAKIEEEGIISLLGQKEISFQFGDIVLDKQKKVYYHPNSMQITAFDKNDMKLMRNMYYSIGGGFIISDDELKSRNDGVIKESAIKLPYDFSTTEELTAMCHEEGCTISDLMLENEKAFRSESQIIDRMMEVWMVMKESVIRGCSTDGVLPGGLNVNRRAPKLHKELSGSTSDPTQVFDWVSLYALAVAEENAAGGRLITAPTNGSAGVIPAVLHYFEQYRHYLSMEELTKFYLTAGAVGILFKKGASISGAEVGCQGEIGVACAMAAAGLAALLGGDNKQIENAAEIGIEHHLGLTCDPVAGLVQVPCIERNTMGAIKAINAARLAMRSTRPQIVSLDMAIKTMKKTGCDMRKRYKETSEGGLAINFTEC
jgi:L-serine dehydratase